MWLKWHRDTYLHLSKVFIESCISLIMILICNDTHINQNMNNSVLKGCLSSRFTLPSTLHFLQIQNIPITTTMSRDPIAAAKEISTVWETGPGAGPGAGPEGEPEVVCGSGVVGAA